MLLEFVHTAHKNTAIIQFLRSEFNSIEVVRGGSVGIEAITMPKKIKKSKKQSALLNLKNRSNIIAICNP